MIGRVFAIAIAVVLTVSTALADELVVRRNVNLREGPSTQTPAIRTLTPPTRLTIENPTKQDNYWRVRTSQNEVGWVWANNVKVVASATAAPAGQARIAAWNFAGFTAIPDTRVKELAEAIRIMNPDVIGVVEVNPDDVASDVAEILTDGGACYKSKILDQTAHQNIAFIYKCAATVDNVRFVPGSNVGNSLLRKALAADVKVGQFDFVMIVLHLKAGRGTGERSTRSSQAMKIAAFIDDETDGPEKDVLVVGDYNMIPGDDQVNFDKMSPGDELRFLSSEDLADGFSHFGSGGQPGNLLDGYAIAASATTEYVDDSVEIVQLHETLGLTPAEYLDDVSDHLPLVATFRTTAADD